ncbi:MAG: DNA repair protein RadC [Eubacterium sp.]|nr:DNA repair protein RadC [Eubacterium sp.]
MSSVKQLPKEERPYERCMEYGPEVLSDVELLSVILRTGTREQNVKELSEKILNSTAEGNLLSLMHLEKEQLQEIKGIGMVKASQLLCIAELAKRISMIRSEKQLRFSMPESIANYYMERFRHLEQEHLYALFLDSKCSLIKEKHLTTGTVNQSLLSNREIFVEALKCNAVFFVLIHNHPSGDCTPSRADIESTRSLVEAGELMGIRLLDHIILGDQKYSSLKELKLLD